MPDLTITLTADHVARIRNTWDPPADQAQVELWVKEQLKEKVISFESRAEADTKDASIRAEVW